MTRRRGNRRDRGRARLLRRRHVANRARDLRRDPRHPRRSVALDAWTRGAAEAPTPGDCMQREDLAMCRWLAYYGKPIRMDKVLYQGAVLADRPEPQVATRRRADERGRVRHRLVLARGRAGGLPQHRARLERPQPARDLGSRRVAPLLRARPRHDGDAGAADELPSVPLRQVALDAQRAHRRLAHRQARPRPRRSTRRSTR